MATLQTLHFCVASNQNQGINHAFGVLTASSHKSFHSSYFFQVPNNQNTMDLKKKIIF